jgi:hypothetical protein
MSMRLDMPDKALAPAMAKQARLMDDDKGIDFVRFSDTVEGCRLSFHPAVGEGAGVFDAVELTDFAIEREKVPQSTGGLEKKPTGTLLLHVSFTLPLAGCGAWIFANFGMDLKLKVQRTQRELALASAEAPPVDDAAAQRIQEGAVAAIAGVEQAQGSGAPPAKKRSRAKKGKK